MRRARARGERRRDDEESPTTSARVPARSSSPTTSARVSFEARSRRLAAGARGLAAQGSTCPFEAAIRRVA